MRLDQGEIAHADIKQRVMARGHGVESALREALLGSLRGVPCVAQVNDEPYAGVEDGAAAFDIGAQAVEERLLIGVDDRSRTCLEGADMIAIVAARFQRRKQQGARLQAFREPGTHDFVGERDSRIGEPGDAQRGVEVDDLL